MNFDTLIDRRATASNKWDKYQGRDILPLWVADMDFASPPSVLAALRQRVDHGVFGYSHAPDSLIESVRDYLLRTYGWAVEPDWLVWLPGLVQGLNLACRAACEPGEGVLTAIPVYPPFLHAPKFSGRQLLTVPLVERAAGWGWDFAELEAAITPKTRLLLLCHPHNPVGRAWRESELSQIIDIARRHGLIVCSDEIHCDLLLDSGLIHTPLAKRDPGFAQSVITLMAPSKTWNLPGLGCAFAVISNPELRQRFRREMAGLVPSPNLLGYAAAEAAYRDDGAWLRGLIEYLRSNRDRLREWLAGSRNLRMTVPEATYLAWIDARAIDEQNPLPRFEAAGVGLSDGRDFGLPGYARLNFGCPRALLDEALRRMEALR